MTAQVRDLFWSYLVVGIGLWLAVVFALKYHEGVWCIDTLILTLFCVSGAVVNLVRWLAKR